MKQLLVVVVLLLVTFSLPISPTITSFISTKNQQFVDQYDRYLFFNGVNAVYKVFPFYPTVLDRFDANNSLSTQDLAALKSWGFNAIRLGLMWPGVETAPQQYNVTYLQQIQKIVDMCNQYDIFVILDMHQDLLSRYTCGEGVPDFYASKFNSTFPSPLPFSLRRDAQGFPLVQDCLAHPFFEYYFSHSVVEMFQSLYTENSELQKGLLQMWAFVADYFKDQTNVLGYEFINEPFFGDFYKHPIEAFENDAKHLQPLYAKLVPLVRKADPNHILFLEPTVSDIKNVGLDFKALADDKLAFSFHVYCSVVKPDGSAKVKTICQVQDDALFKWRVQNAKQLQAPLFLTEYGAIGNSTGGVVEVDWILQQADLHSISRCYWQYKYYNDITTAAKPGNVESFFDSYGNIQEEKVKNIARTYAQKLCGLPLSSKFDVQSGSYEVQYKVNNPNCINNPQVVTTDIYVAKGFYYGKGFDVQLMNCKGCQVVRDSTNIVKVVHSSSVALGDTVQVRITAK